MFEDRRTYPRRKAMLSFKVLFGAAELSCVTTDISPSGAFFAARNSPPIGEEIGIDVRPTGVKIPPVHVKAEVVRVNPLGSGLQPGFAVRFLSAHSDAGGASIYHVLRRVLHVLDIAPDDLPESGVVVFRFPEGGEPLDLQSARIRRPVTTTGSGARLTGRPLRPIQDAMPRDRRGQRVRSSRSSMKLGSEASRWATTDEPSTVQTPPPRALSSHDRPEFGLNPGRGRASQQMEAVANEPEPAPSGRSRASDAGMFSAAAPTGGAARVISAEPSNAFAGARPRAAAADSGIFSPPGSTPHFAPAPAPTPPALDRPPLSAHASRTSAERPHASGPPTPSRAPHASESGPPRRPAADATFHLDDRDDSGFFDQPRPETSRIVAPFSNQSSSHTRRKSQASQWSVYESGIQERVTARRVSDVIIQDDPFATGARKVAARFREKAEQERDSRREQREREREQLRAKLAKRQRNPRPGSGAFSVDGDGGERSMIFARSGQNSTIGGPMLTGMTASPALPENATVAVQAPVTYELDGRFVPGTMVSAAPLAVEIHSTDQVPQLDQKLVLNMAVHDDQRWRTIYLMGKLLRVPERRGGGQSFVLHIERVHEGKLPGAYNRFLTSAHAEGT